MAPPNLTRTDAERRAALLDVVDYAVELDLTDGGGKPGESTFATTSTVRFRCAEPGADSWIDFVGAEVRLGHAERRTARRQRLPRGGRHRAPRPRRGERAAGRRDGPVHEHRRGPAPLRRPGRRRRVPVLAVRDGRREAHVRLLRPARPQGPLHADRHRAHGLEGRLQRGDRRDRRGRGRRRSAPVRDVRDHVHVPGGADRGPLRGVARRVPRRGGIDPARHLLPRVARPAHGRRAALHRDQAGLRLLPPQLRRAVPVRRSTTSSSSPSSTRARWRTRAR